MMHGHFGAALIISGLTNRSAPLSILFLASQIQDFLIAVLVYILNIEITRLSVDAIEDRANKVYPFELTYVPYSHSLFSTVCLAALLYAAVPGTASCKMAVAFAVLSHWILDLIVHLPDLDICFPFLDCGKAGLGLWHYVVPSLVVESALIFIGSLLYIRMAPSALIARRVGIRLFPLVLLMVFVTIALPFAPPPPKLDYTIAVQTFVIYGLIALFARVIESTLVSANAEGKSE